MIPHDLSIRSLGRLARAAVLAPLLLGTLAAQPATNGAATGVVSGRVSDAETGRSLQGAIVSIWLKDKPKGDATLEVLDAQGAKLASREQGVVLQRSRRSSEPARWHTQPPMRSVNAAAWMLMRSATSARASSP